MSGLVIEARLAEVWASVLCRDQVRATENFFELGGTSLQAVRLIARVEEVFDIHMSVRAVFEAEHLREMASNIGVALREEPQGMGHDASALEDTDTDR